MLPAFARGRLCLALALALCVAASAAAGVASWWWVSPYIHAVVRCRSARVFLCSRSLTDTMLLPGG